MRRTGFHNYPIFLLSLLVLLNACGNLPNRDNRSISIYKQQLKDKISVKQSLYLQFKEWQATRYRLGGLSKKGIDCSGFVYVTFISRFGIKLPRTTKLQARSGAWISQNELKAGDLVFFKTGFSLRHVGIYLEKRKFVHASTSNGVAISSLDNGYWSKKYWKSIRI